MWIKDIEEFLVTIEAIEIAEEADRHKEANKMIKKFKIKPHNFNKELKRMMGKDEMKEIRELEKKKEKEKGKDKKGKGTNNKEIKEKVKKEKVKKEKVKNNKKEDDDMSVSTK